MTFKQDSHNLANQMHWQQKDKQELSVSSHT
jgi:hypothetical protein